MLPTHRLLMCWQQFHLHGPFLFTWSLGASFSKISMSHSSISTAFFVNEIINIKIILIFASRGSLQFILQILGDFKPFQAMFWCHSLYWSRSIKLFSFLEPNQWIIILPCHFPFWCSLKSTMWTGLGWFLFFLYWKT
jgi:hypothetical protein